MEAALLTFFLAVIYLAGCMVAILIGARPPRMRPRPPPTAPVPRELDAPILPAPAPPHRPLTPPREDSLQATYSAPPASPAIPGGNRGTWRAPWKVDVLPGRPKRTGAVKVWPRKPK